MAEPIIGGTAQIILDGFPYWLLANTYMAYNPRLRKATPRADGAESYADFGLGKKIWKFTVLCLNDLTTYDGTPTGFTGQQWHDTLQSSYARVNTIMVYTDLDSSNHNVRFDHLAFHVPNPASQTTGLSYHADVELVEA